MGNSSNCSRLIVNYCAHQPGGEEHDEDFKMLESALEDVVMIILALGQQLVCV
jgi:hypothetical protein